MKQLFMSNPSKNSEESDEEKRVYLFFTINKNKKKIPKRRVSKR
jgi:hypothetical protein